MSSAKSTIAVFALLFALTGCSGGSSTTQGASSQGGSTSSTPVPSPTATSSAPVVGHDGRTLLPSGEATACSLVSEATVKKALGNVAANLQPAQPSLVRAPDGTTTDSCLHAFDQSGTTTNGLVVEVVTYPASAAAEASRPYALLMDPEDVKGTAHPAKYAMNALSSSKEFVLVSVNGARITRLIAAMPTAGAWDRNAGRDALVQLAKDAGL